MSVELTKEQEEFRGKIRSFAEEKLAPIVFQLDQQNEFPTAIVKELGEMGVFGTPFPKEYGGLGLDTQSYAVAVEELARVDGGTGVILSAHVSLGSWPIFAFGTEEQKQKYLKPLASGEKLGAFGLTEPEAGSDAGGTQTIAVLDGDHYILNGSKVFITNADRAETYVVFAVTTPGIGTKGISAFIVEKGWKGFTFGTHYNKMGIRSSATAELVFRDVIVPKENLLGKEGEGFKIAMQTLEGGRIGIAAQALGIAQGAFEKALAYSKERVQFEKPISRQQVISFKLADMATKLQAARLMVYHAAQKKDAHIPYGVDSAMAKQYASDIGLEVVNDAVQIYGGSGYIKGFDVERMYRDAKICTIYEGTNEIQRLVISGALLGKEKKQEKPAAPAAPASPASKLAGQTGPRKGVLLQTGTAEEKVQQLLHQVPADVLRVTAPANPDLPLSQADRIVSVGKGLKEKEDLSLIQDLADSVGAQVGSSRPVAEERGWFPLDHYVGISGQRFKGSLYIAVGISGQIQHLRGIHDAGTIIAINSDPQAPIFQNADYGIVGDLYEILPLLIQALK